MLRETGGAEPESGDAWAVERCGFPTALRTLDTARGADDSPIAMIDVGNGALDHPYLRARRVRLRREPSSGPPSTALHASAVAGTIVRACPAPVHVYNAWTTSGFDLRAFLDSIDDIIASGARVLNLSVGSPERAPAIDAAIKKCFAADIVVVAPTGDYEEDRVHTDLYPAGLDGVIAVGATNLHDRRRPSSGIHKVWIAAPGERIWTVVSDDAFGYRDGTSFATAFVSAAVWLILRTRPGLSATEIKEVLKQCVDDQSKQARKKTGKPTEELGYGRLDVRGLARGEV